MTKALTEAAIARKRMITLENMVKMVVKAALGLVVEDKTESAAQRLGKPTSEWRAFYTQRILLWLARWSRCQLSAINTSTPPLNNLMNLVRSILAGVCR